KGPIGSVGDAPAVPCRPMAQYKRSPLIASSVLLSSSRDFCRLVWGVRLCRKWRGAFLHVGALGRRAVSLEFNMNDERPDPGEGVVLGRTPEGGLSRRISVLSPPEDDPDYDLRERSGSGS